MPNTVIAEARLRERNQVTIPDAIVREARLEPGDTFIVELDSAQGTIRLRRMPTSFAGALRGVYGDDAGRYLEGERNSLE